ncbi:hypothetical protein CHARACLAT_007761 [Characodon lateralis]|uniref:Uncharacterized protein n=1 Tax=Characodon lateralis TaxID=208331 RepID=A0ABU7E086_9TELE|nr:hypothetical protein [Characodon lateralis]
MAAFLCLTTIYTALVNIFPQNISVQDIFVSSQRPTTCHVHQQQDLAEKSNSVCEKCFSCEVYVSVDPASNVKTVQTDISALLSIKFSVNFLTIQAVHDSINVLPAEIFAHVTEPPPTVTASSTTSDRGLTKSAPPRPANLSTTGEPLDLTVTVVMQHQFFRVKCFTFLSYNTQ